MGKKATIVAFRDEDLATLMPGDFTPLNLDQIKDLPVWLGPRPFLETYPEFRQLIPYILIRKDDRYLNYRREISGGEERLHGNISMGFGGHVDAADTTLNDDGAVDLIDTLMGSTSRELAEEIGLIGIDIDKFDVIGAIRTNVTDVDLHHVAVVCVMDTTDDTRGLVFEDTIGEPSFNTLEEIMNNSVEKETWTRLVLEHLTNVQ